MVDTIVTLKQALDLQKAGLPQRPGYGSYYYGNAGTYSGTVVDGAMYDRHDLDWYGNKLLAAPTRVECQAAVDQLLAAVGRL
jgi:hypothetical protein